MLPAEKRDLDPAGCNGSACIKRVFFPVNNGNYVQAIYSPTLLENPAVVLQSDSEFQMLPDAYGEEDFYEPPEDMAVVLPAER